MYAYCVDTEVHPIMAGSLATLTEPLVCAIHVVELGKVMFVAIATHKLFLRKQN